MGVSKVVPVRDSYPLVSEGMDTDIVMTGEPTETSTPHLTATESSNLKIVVDKKFIHFYQTNNNSPFR